MTSIATTAAYLLITVSGLGEVRTTQQPDHHACVEARSVALYGKTIEEDGAAVAARRAVEEEKHRAWDASHAFRPAKNENERRYVTEFASGRLFATSGYEFKAPDMIRESYDESSMGPSYRPGDGEWTDFHAGVWVVHQGHDSRTAVCAPAEGTDVRP